MNLDFDKPIFSHKQAEEFTSADFKTIDNYVLHKHVKPTRLDGRRLFSLRQLVEIDLIARLAGLFKIPPSTGAVLAATFANDPMVQSDASSVGNDQWVLKSAGRLRATIKRFPNGDVEALLGVTDPEAIDIMVPVQMFARLVMVKASQSVEAID